MLVRPFDPADTEQIVRLFRETIRCINRRDYTDDQVVAWALDAIDHLAWQERLLANETVVVLDDDMIVGFAELETTGRIHMMFVHKDHQRRGIASSLLQELESRAKWRGLDCLDTEASITARPFFERRGYVVIRPQTVQLRGQSLTNYKMKKRLKVAADPA